MLSPGPHEKVPCVWLALRSAVVGASLATSPTVAEPPTEVTLTVDADAGLSDSAVADALAAHLAELERSVRVEREATEARPRVSLSRMPSGAVRVEVWLEGTDTPWTREIPDDGDPDLLLESIGVVVRGMLVAEPPEPEPQEEAEPAPEPERKPAPTPRPPSQLDLSLAYRGETVAPDLLWHDGAAAALSWQAPRGWMLDAAVAWMPRQPIRRGPGEGLAIQRVHASLGAGFRFRRDRRVRPAVLATVGAELFDWSEAALNTEGQPGAAARVSAGALGELQVDLGAGVFAIARLGINAWFFGAELVSTRPQGERSLVQTSVASGWGALGLGYRFFFIRNRRRAATAQVSE